MIERKRSLTFEEAGQDGGRDLDDQTDVPFSTVDQEKEDDREEQETFHVHFEELPREERAETNDLSGDERPLNQESRSGARMKHDGNQAAEAGRFDGRLFAQRVVRSGRKAKRTTRVSNSKNTPVQSE